MTSTITRPATYAVRSAHVLTAIFERFEFDTHGELSARYGMPDSGRLPRNMAALMLTMVNEHVDPVGVALTVTERSQREDDVYTVYSYRTPIAVHVPSTGWIVFGCRFSVTTSKHQHVVAEALHGVPTVHVGDYRGDLMPDARALMAVLIDPVTITNVKYVHPRTLASLTSRELARVYADGIVWATDEGMRDTYATVADGGDITRAWSSINWQQVTR